MGTGGRVEEKRLSPNEASYGYPSNTDYYVVPPLTLMGCYNDLKWFNGSQVGAPNGPLYTPMRIMNGNDSVVKCLCFSLFFCEAAAQAVWQVSFCVVIGRQTLRQVTRWVTDDSQTPKVFSPGARSFAGVEQTNAELFACFLCSLILYKTCLLKTCNNGS